MDVPNRQVAHRAATGIGTTNGHQTVIPKGAIVLTAVHEVTVAAVTSDEDPEVTTTEAGCHDMSGAVNPTNDEKSPRDTLTSVGISATDDQVQETAIAGAAQATISCAVPLPAINPVTPDGRWAAMRDGKGGTHHPDVTQRAAQEVLG